MKKKDFNAKVLKFFQSSKIIHFGMIKHILVLKHLLFIQKEFALIWYESTLFIFFSLMGNFYYNLFALKDVPVRVLINLIDS